MDQYAPRPRTAATAVFLTSLALATVGAQVPLAAQTPPRQVAAQPQPAGAEKQVRQSTKGEQAIVVLVNDEPVTAYEIQERAKFLAVNANISQQAQEAFKRLVQADSTNQRVRAILDEVVRSNPGKTREQIGAIFEERKKQFAIGLQKQAMESARTSMVPKFRKEAQEELIDERLKVQEAKRLGFEVPDEEIKRTIKGVAERNKMTEEQFAQHLKGMGVDISTMRDRFKAQFAWREAVRRLFSAQISITHRDVDRMISAHASEAGEDTVELQVQKITLLLPGKMEQSSMARRYVEADGLRTKFGGCKTMASLANDLSDARFQDMSFIRPSSIGEPTRSMLLSAKDGDMLPPATAATGIEIYAVCGRRPIKADEKVREKAQEELAQKEFEIVAKRHLRDLRQDAHIEYR
jgi:peptidyl-prolyl cis-trans isomerase SurA